MPTPRKRLKRIDDPRGARFITASCNQRLPLFNNTAIRDVFTEALVLTLDRHPLNLHAWVVMPEHIHLLVSPVAPQADGDSFALAPILVTLKQTVSQRVIPRWKELNVPILGRLKDTRGSIRFWQPGGGFDRNVRDEAELARTIQYIHRNPTERGLVTQPSDWHWSSIHWWLGDQDRVPRCTYPSTGHDWSVWKGFQ